MENSLNIQDTTIRTKIKFVKSSETGFTVGFVSRNPKTGMWRGVRQDSSFPKKVCVLDRKLISTTILNRLYDVVLTPMRNGNGYVVIDATPVAFSVKVSSTHVPHLIYRVEAKFGEKTIIFDPMEGNRSSVRSIKGAVDALAKRTDVKDIQKAVDEFEDAASTMLNLYKSEMPQHAISRFCI